MAPPEVDVAVVGAGYSGLTAAWRLHQAGRSVVVLEARDRIGFRVWTETRPDGTWIDRGGAWLGPGQDRPYALAAEMGVPTYAQYVAGDNVSELHGKAIRLDVRAERPRALEARSSPPADATRSAKPVDDDARHHQRGEQRARPRE
ncbi:MAG: FAD-dependent oxidoreductase, partial [Candidatus Binatia bacterium]